MNSERAGAEPVFAGQRVEGQAAVADRPDHTRDPVIDAGVRPNTPRHFGVGGRELDREHLGRWSGAGDSQRAVAAVGPQFQRHARVGAADRGVEQLALLVADVDQERLLMCELVDLGDHVVDVAPACVGDDVVGSGGFAPVADLAGLGDVPSPDRQPPERPAQKRHPLLQGHDRQRMRTAGSIGFYVARGSARPGSHLPLNLPGCPEWVWSA